jgi:peptidoglycan/xylan/chitin deacetylase (PgdA/CDA1 family)
MSGVLRRLFLRGCELSGLFRAARWGYRHRLQILCYHGFQIDDECRFKPQLFISQQRFRERLEHIKRKGFRVLPLGEALERLRAGTLPERSLAITIDDGFYSTLSIAAPLLREFGFPATVYVTTYYMEKEAPVFRHAVQYLLWKSKSPKPEASHYQGLFEAAGLPRFEVGAEGPLWAFIRAAEAVGSEPMRQKLLRGLADLLKLDPAPLIDQKLLTLMSARDVQAWHAQSFDVQLHTHHHRFPANDRTAACQEIEENRKRLEALVGGPLRHFCYPSGQYEEHQWPWLREIGIESATTCQPGLNHGGISPYGLTRFLDSEAIDSIEFRAQLSGFSEVLRTIRSGLRRALSRPMRETHADPISP